MADGLALLVAPRHVVEQVRQLLALAPRVLGWEGLGAFLGLVLVIGTRGLRYESLWAFTGLAMIAKGLFLAASPDAWRQRVVEWCLRRDDVDYRFWGLSLCMLAILLLHASGWVGGK
ncbi:DUF2065 family protein [Candidatus Nitrospira bockiana]